MRRKIEELLHADKVTLRNGIFKVYRGYYYRHGQTMEDFANYVSKKLAEYGHNILIIGMDDQWVPFKGGAPVQKQSHFSVTFKLIA